MTDEPLVSWDEFAHDAPLKFLMCRDLGHVWQPFTGSYDEAAGVITREMRCRSCKSIRRQEMTTHGHVLKNAYNYANGYQAKNVDRTDGYSRDPFRLEAALRFLRKV